MDILILIGSESDLPYIKNTTNILDDFRISYQLRITSAHRTPEETKEIILSAEKEQAKIIIAAAGYSAHLPGVCASFTSLPVIGIPIDNSPLKGTDSLYSIVMMPAGVPVACMALGEAGAKNAAYYALKILALNSQLLAKKLKKFREDLKKKVIISDKNNSIVK